LKNPGIYYNFVCRSAAGSSLFHQFEIRSNVDLFSPGVSNVDKMLMKSQIGEAERFRKKHIKSFMNAKYEFMPLKYKTTTGGKCVNKSRRRQQIKVRKTRRN